MTTRKILLGFLGLMVALGAIVSRADMWQITKQDVEWRTGLNSSADTGQVRTTVADSTAWFGLWALSNSPDDPGVGVRKWYLPDSISVTFKVTNDGVAADSFDVTVALQTSDDKTTLSSTKTVATLTEPITAATSELMGFTWQPAVLVDEGTPLGRYGRYFVTPQTVSGDDSCDISDMKNRYWADR